jgi:hypothetical protein
MTENHDDHEGARLSRGRRTIVGAEAEGDGQGTLGCRRQDREDHICGSDLGKSVTLKLEKLWDRNVTLTTRLVDTVTTPMLLKAVLAGHLKPRLLITHEFRLDEMMRAYDTFGDAAKNKALKVILRAG